jgi:diguanylate cyclase (GGDEF)-like protein/PAS domain S-box-containing protein
LQRVLESIGLTAETLDTEAGLDAFVGRVEAGFRGLFVESPQPMWVLAADTGRIVGVNRAAIAKYGYTAEEFTGLPAAAIQTDTELFAAHLVLARSQPTAITTRHRLKDGSRIDVEITTSPLEFLGRPSILSVINDVTDRKRLERELRQGAFRDPVTGGANRAVFMERASHALTRMRGYRSAVAVLVADIDGLADVNASLGYTTGDSVLEAVAQRLAQAVRPGDMVARLVGDEFGVLLEEAKDLDRAVEVAERLHEAFAAPLFTAVGALTIALSIGVAATSSTQTDADELVRDAALAMHAAKAAGRGRVVAFTPGMGASATGRLSLAQDLRRAVESAQLRVLFQPVIAVPDGTIVGCEALVRWQHPSRGLVAPDTFIPLAEEIGMISDIDTWVLRSACRQVAEWRSSSPRDLFVAVNASSRDLGRGELVDRVEGALLASGLPPDRLEVEITESTAVAQPGEALGELRQLRRAGVTVAIDDFGTGYSSLSKLATLPVDRLKIDRAFISQIKHTKDDAPLVAAMIALAHRLGLEVTAEGVETAEQLAFLRHNDCDLLQGYLFSPPVSPARFWDLLLAEARTDLVGVQETVPGGHGPDARKDRRRSRIAR